VVARIPIRVRKWETADKILSEEIGDGSEKLAFADHPSVFSIAFCDWKWERSLNRPKMIL
jgi:hypothetical protein